MLDKFLSAVNKIINALPFSGPTWFIIILAIFFIWLFSKAHRNPNSRINWEDLVVDTVTQTVSPYKIGYLIGVVLVSFIMLVLLDQGKLTLDILAACLTYLLGGAGWTNFLQQKTKVAQIEAEAEASKKTN